MPEKSTIKVVGVGLPRTGTASLQEALMILGFTPCHHMITDVLADSFPFRKPKRWLSVFREEDMKKRQKTIKAIFDDGKFKATVDFPPSAFPDDLVDIYPEAKFILGKRKSPEQWRASFNQTIKLFNTSWWLAATWVMPSTRMVVIPMFTEYAKRYKSVLSVEIAGESTAPYVKHNEWVRQVVPKERLLEHEPRDGWVPLCEFLNVKVPDCPYPHKNEREPLRKWLFQLAMIGVGIWLGTFALASAGLYYLYTSLAK